MHECPHKNITVSMELRLVPTYPAPAPAPAPNPAQSQKARETAVPLPEVRRTITTGYLKSRPPTCHTVLPSGFLLPGAPDHPGVALLIQPGLLILNSVWFDRPCLRRDLIPGYKSLSIMCIYTVVNKC